MSIKLPNEQRIVELERTVAKLAGELAAMRSAHTPSSPDQIIRPVRTVNPSEGSYPATGSTVPIVFRDVEHSGIPGDPTFTARSAAQQNAAATLDGTLPAVSTNHIAFRYNRQWFLISAGGGSEWQVLDVSTDGGDPGDETDPCTLTYELDSDPTTYNTLSPSFPIRPPFGRMIPGTKGIFDSDMNLIMVNEHLDLTTDP